MSHFITLLQVTFDLPMMKPIQEFSARRHCLDLMAGRTITVTCTDSTKALFLEGWVTRLSSYFRLAYRTM